MSRLVELLEEQELNMKHRKYLYREILKKQNELRKLKLLIIRNNAELAALNDKMSNNHENNQST